MTKQPICCHIDQESKASCGKPATHEIHDGYGPDDYTHACREHLGEMLGDAKELHIYRIDQEGRDGLGERRQGAGDGDGDATGRTAPAESAGDD